MVGSCCQGVPSHYKDILVIKGVHGDYKKALLLLVEGNEGRLEGFVGILVVIHDSIGELSCH